MRRLTVAATIIAAALAAAAPASALDWSAPILLEPTPPGFEVTEGPVAVAANARGDAIAVWVRERHSDEGTTCCDDQRVIASYRPAGGRFGKPETISRLGDEATGADVAMDPAGNAFVAWVVNDTSADLEIAPGGVGVALRRAGAHRFGPPRLLTKQPGSDVHVAAGAAGQAVVAWQRLTRPAPHDLLYPRQVMAALQSGPARFAPPVAVSGLNAATDLGDGVRLPLEMHPTAVTDRSGATYLAWARTDGARGLCCHAVEVSRRAGSGSFERPVVASGPVPGEAQEDLVPFVASSPWGAVISWSEANTLVTRDWPVGQPLGAPSTLALSPRSGLSALGVADDGMATALFTLAGPSGATLDFALASARRAPGGTFGQPEEIERSAGGGSLVVDPDGSAHAIWTRFTKESCDRFDCRATGPLIDAGDAAAGGAFGNVRNVSSRDKGAGPSIAAAHGGALAGWLGDHGPWVAELGAPIGRAPVARAVQGPRVRRFAKTGPRTFTFQLSKPARVLIDITRVEDIDEIRRAGQAVVSARRGAGHLTLPRRIKLRRGRSYAATLIAQDASGHDSRSIAPLYFRVR